ncbi:GNAT family N-acetyltransferase [Hypericibacter sp.]|uniref:GNAT family N-acetyltransferase n=1 Tax=Hypericibacter sp. TaxID=2705401 RepID=UPI003D6C8A06
MSGRPVPPTADRVLPNRPKPATSGLTKTGKPVDIRAGDLELRLAENEAEIEAAQRLRYQVFYREMSAEPTPEMAAAGRDFDSFDPFCDHLLVIDRRVGEGAAGVVGTYRLLRRSRAADRGRFYSVDEYDIAPLVAHPGEVLELGRSCIDAEHRSRAAMQLLWRGIADYVMYHDVTLMFGCASLPGIDPAAHALPLSYLYYNHLAPEALRPRALSSRYVDMQLMPRDAIDLKAALLALPPLIKGYLRLGGFVGDGAVVDTQFNTTDVCVIVKTDWVTDKYFKHYTREDAASRTPTGPA